MAYCAEHKSNRLSFQAFVFAVLLCSVSGSTQIISPFLFCIAACAEQELACVRRLCGRLINEADLDRCVEDSLRLFRSLWRNGLKHFA